MIYLKLGLTTKLDSTKSSTKGLNTGNRNFTETKAIIHFRKENRLDTNPALNEIIKFNNINVINITSNTDKSSSRLK